MADIQDDNAPSFNKQLLAAARDDNEDLLVGILEMHQGKYDINCTDGLGNTPLHNAVKYGSADVLEHILSEENCDVDPQNRTDRATPLHLCVQVENKEIRAWIFENLLDAGADTSVKDKNGHTVLDYLTADDEDLRALIRKYQTQSSVSNADIASDDDDEPGSGSGSEED